MKVNLAILSTIILILCEFSDSNASTAVNKTKYFNGLLSDFLRIQFEFSENLTVSSKCKNELELIQNGLNEREIWAMKLLDASGRVTPGFVWGNNYWFGSKKECERVNEPTHVVLSENLPQNHVKNLTDIASPFPVENKLVWARHQSQWQLDINAFDKTIVHMSLCLPMSCTDDDIANVASKMLNDASFGERYFFDNLFEIIESKTLKLRDDYFSISIVYTFLSVLILNFCLILLSSVYTNFLTKHEKDHKQHRNQSSADTSNNNNANVMVNVDTSMSATEEAERKRKINKRINRRNLFIDRFFACFSLSKNSSIITTNNLGSDSIEVIHGMRALGMIWIIAGHLFFYGPAAIENLSIILTYAESWYLQPLFAVAMAVDSYFVISGLVLSYLFFQTEKKKKKESPIIKFVSSVVNRYLRLTPPYLVAILLTGFTAIFLRDKSIYWMIEPNDVNCQQYWWRNILYIQNMYPLDDMCMSWSWFLATDFQCFCLTSFLLVIYTKLPKTAVSIFVVVFVASSVFTGYLGYILSYSLSLDVQYKTIDYLYTPTYTRIGAYFIGVFAGWYLSRYDRKLNIEKKYLILGWIIGPALLLTMVFGPTKKSLNSFEAILFTGLGKTAWSIGVAWIIVACATGHGGIVNRILSAKSLLPYSRMTYTAYLINPLVITFVLMMCEAPVHLDFLTLLINSFGFEVIVFILSYFFMLLFENPFIRLGKLIQGK